jgi:hypothetical protein
MVFHRVDKAATDEASVTLNLHGNLYRAVPESGLDRVVAKKVLPRVATSVFEIKNPVTITPVPALGHVFDYREYFGIPNNGCYLHYTEEEAPVVLCDALRDDTDLGALIHRFSVASDVKTATSVNNRNMNYRLCSNEEIGIYYVIKLYDVMKRYKVKLGDLTDNLLIADRLDKIDNFITVDHTTL